MTEKVVLPNKYIELRSIYKYHIDAYNALYQLKTKNEEELRSIYTMIKTNLIDSKKYPPKYIMKDILNIIPHNNRYTKSYLKLAKFISDDYHVTEVKNIQVISNYLFYREYGIILDKSYDFERFKFKNIDFDEENTIYRAIMYDDKERFISFIVSEEFDEDQVLESNLYPINYDGYSLLELCCYYGAIDCFKFLVTTFDKEKTQLCLPLSFIGRNLEIISECLKYLRPNQFCMIAAIISHSIDFVSFLMNEYNINIIPYHCGIYNNLDSFLVYFDYTNDYKKCFVYSPMFNIISLCEYFLSLGANINEKDINGKTALHIAAEYNSKETAEFLLLHGVNINEKNKYGDSALHNAADKNSKETAELLLLHGVNINEKNKYGNSALHYAADKNSREIVELLLSRGASINERNNNGETALHNAADKNNKEIVELLLSYGVNVNEKNNNGETALHIAAFNNNKEIVEDLLLHGVNINEKDDQGGVPLHVAAFNNNKEIVELLLSHESYINDKDEHGKITLRIPAYYNRKEAVELLLTYGVNIIS